jgi:hypothetical protein
LAGESACPTWEGGDQEIGAAAFERADGIYRFDLENDTESFTFELRGVQENRVDGSGRGFDSIRM